MGKSRFGLKRLSFLSRGEDQDERDTMDIVPLLVESILEDERKIQNVVDEFKENLDLINIHLKAGQLHTKDQSDKTRAEHIESSYKFALEKFRKKINETIDKLEKF